jgi:hypothetical protein
MFPFSPPIMQHNKRNVEFLYTLSFLSDFRALLYSYLKDVNIGHT